MLELSTFGTSIEKIKNIQEIKVLTLEEKCKFYCFYQNDKIILKIGKYTVTADAEIHLYETFNFNYKTDRETVMITSDGFKFIQREKLYELDLKKGDKLHFTYYTNEDKEEASNDIINGIRQYWDNSYKDKIFTSFHIHIIRESRTIYLYKSVDMITHIMFHNKPYGNYAHNIHVSSDDNTFEYDIYL